MNSLHSLEEITRTLVSHSIDPNHCQTHPNFALKNYQMLIVGIYEL